VGVFNVENVENTWVTLLSHVSLIRPTIPVGMAICHYFLYLHLTI